MDKLIPSEMSGKEMWIDGRYFGLNEAADMVAQMGSKFMLRKDDRGRILIIAAKGIKAFIDSSLKSTSEIKINGK